MTYVTNNEIDRFISALTPSVVPILSWCDVRFQIVDEISKHDIVDVTNVDDVTNVMFYLP